MYKSYLEAAKSVLLKHNKPLHKKEIAELLINDYPKSTVDELSNKIGIVIYLDIKKNGRKSDFRRVFHKKGKKKVSVQGKFMLKTQEKTLAEKTIKGIKNYEGEPGTDKARYTGKAGEHAVISELLFRDFNISILEIDEGIDIIATKNNKTFNIQVKTGYYKNKKLTASLKTERFKQYNTYQTYYIIVFRYYKDGWQNEYFIFNSRELQKYLPDIDLKKSKTFNIVLQENRFYISNHDITKHLNNFDEIKP